MARILWSASQQPAGHQPASQPASSQPGNQPVSQPVSNQPREKHFLERQSAPMSFAPIDELNELFFLVLICNQRNPPTTFRFPSLGTRVVGHPLWTRVVGHPKGIRVIGHPKGIRGHTRGYEKNNINNNSKVLINQQM